MESYLVQVQLNDSCRDSDCHSAVSHPHPKRDFRLSRFSFWIRQFFPRFDWITTLFSVLAVAGILFAYVPKHQTVVPQLSAVSHTSKFVSVTDVNQDVVSHLFELKVVGQDDIELAVVRASCGCMSFAVDGDPLTKGHWVNVNDRRVMKFAVQVPARPGVEQHNFEVQARLRKSPQIVSTPVRCSTQTSIYKPLVVRTNQVQGSFRSPDDPVSITVDLQLVVPSGSAPPVDELSIALADPLSSFHVQPREKQSGRREKLSDEWDSWAVSLGAIVIPSSDVNWVEASRRFGNAFTLTVTRRGFEYQHDHCPVSIVDARQLQVPRSIHFGQRQQGREFTASFVVRSVDSVCPEILEVKSSLPECCVTGFTQKVVGNVRIVAASLRPTGKGVQNGLMTVVPKSDYAPGIIQFNLNTGE